MKAPKVTVEIGDKKIVINSEEALDKLHDELYKQIDLLLKKYNPCRIKEGSCYCYEKKLHDESFCCKRCKYLTEKGCSVQSLTCKFHLCSDMMYDRTKVNKPLPKKFTDYYFKLKNIQKLFFVDSIRSDKKTTVKKSWQSKVRIDCIEKGVYGGEMC